MGTGIQNSLYDHRQAGGTNGVSPLFAFFRLQLYAPTPKRKRAPRIGALHYFGSGGPIIAGNRHRRSCHCLTHLILGDLDTGEELPCTKGRETAT